LAQELNIPDSDQKVKIRNPWAVALLPFITFGIYHLVWWFRVNKEMKAFGEVRGYDLGRNPTNSLLALFPGFLIIIPPLVSYWRGTQRVQGTSALANREPVNGWIALVLYIFISPAMFAYLQVSLNHVWEQELGSGAPGGDAMPAKLADCAGHASSFRCLPTETRRAPFVISWRGRPRPRGRPSQVLSLPFS
jgi:hypothetical protein